MKSHSSIRATISLFLVVAILMINCLGLVACNDNNDDNDNTEHSENNEYSDISKIMLARGVAYVDSDREVIERTDWNLLSIDIPQAIDGFKDMFFEPTDDVPTDVEYLRFDVIYKDNETVKTVYILYDFILKKDYLIYEGETYFLYGYMKLWYYSVYLPLYHCGDAWYFRNASIKDFSFRFEQRWTDGFAILTNWSDIIFDFSDINCPETQIDSTQAAKEYLSELLQLQGCPSVAFYDKVTDYYLVEFKVTQPYNDLLIQMGSEMLQKQREIALYAVIDNNGQIIQLYSSIMIFEDYME
jgi:hypothetical protein